MVSVLLNLVFALIILLVMGGYQVQLGFYEANRLTEDDAPELEYGQGEPIYDRINVNMIYTNDPS
jgi:hypothetical protein